MELPSLFSSALPDSARKLFIAVLVTESSVQASLWEVSEGSIAVLAHSDVQRYISSTELVTKTDQCLQDLGKESENIDEVIFGLEPEWVDAQGIIDERKPLLKKITDELSLKAVGFVVTVEALLHHLVQIPETQSVILVRFDTDQLHVSLIKQGKIVGTRKVGKSGNTAADLTEALARFETATDTAAMPLKVLLFSTTLTDEELSQEEQGLIEHDWVGSKLFAQVPLFELLPPNLLIDVVSREGGKAVAQSLGLLPATTSPTIQPAAYDNVAPVSEDEVNEGPLPTSFGIPIKQQVASHEAQLTAPSSISAVVPTSTEETLPEEDSDEVSKKLSPFAAFKTKITHFFTTKNGQVSYKKFALGGFVGGLIALLVVGYAYLFFTTKAVATIELKTATISQEARLTLDPAVTAADVDKMVLPARVVTQEVSGSEATVTTGTKLVGDPAKGKVTLFNKTTSPKTFDSGTVVSSGSLKFTLDSSVTVASASVSVDSSAASETKTFGKAEVSITASAIGTESNLAKDTNFTVANFDSSTYAASNPEPLTGGASREVRVVSAEDRQKLLSQLKQKLITDSQAKFKENISTGTSVVPTGKFTVSKEEFNAKVGEEVNQLTLNLTGVAEGLAYQNQDLQPISQAILSAQVPSGHELVPNELQVLSSPEPVSSASARVALTANVSSKTRPIISDEELKESIAGKSLKAAEEVLKNRSEVRAVEFTFQPSIAKQLLGRLPTASRLQLVFK